MPFVSRAQQRYAFATGQPWAERWAEETPSFEALPERTKKMLKRKERRRSAIKADAPAPEKDRIFGSEKNPEGSAASAGSGRGIEITEAVESALRTKMQAHNERNDTDGKRATMGMLRAVWRRGAGAFSVSHRPGMTRQQWAMARVNAFLHLLARGKPENAKYVSDNDLLPEGHPKSTRKRSAIKAQIRFKSLIKGAKPKSGGGGAEVMERIAGELCRSRDGRFVSCSSREATPESKRELRKKERMQERQKEEAENMARIGDALSLERDALGALFAFGDRDKPKPLSEEQATALEALGLVERGDDGTPRISSSGNAFLRAVRSGDEARSRDTLAVSKERAERLRVAAEEAAAAEAEPVEEKKPKGGGGGRGAKPDAEQQAKEREQKRALRMLRAADAGRDLTTGQRRELERLGYGRRVDGRFVLNAAGRRALASNSTKAADSVVPPQAVRDAARRALEVREQKPPSQRGMTAVGLARARDLANGRPVSFETLRRMKAYFDRHEVDKQGSTWGEQGKGWQAWMGWGGDPGRAWVNRMLRQTDSEVKDVDDVDLLLLEAEIAIKHGRHNQATHGRKTGRRSAYTSAYRSARAGGASTGEARAKAKEESRNVAQQERAQRLQQRTERLQTQAERARRAATSGQMTESQARRALQRAENLEARARGEAVPNRRQPKGATPAAETPRTDFTRPSAKVAADAQALRERLVRDFGGPPLTDDDRRAINAQVVQETVKMKPVVRQRNKIKRALQTATGDERTRLQSELDGYEAQIKATEGRINEMLSRANVNDTRTNADRAREAMSQHMAQHITQPKTSVLNVRPGVPDVGKALVENEFAQIQKMVHPDLIPNRVTVNALNSGDVRSNYSVVGQTLRIPDSGSAYAAQGFPRDILAQTMRSTIAHEYGHSFEGNERVRQLANDWRDRRTAGEPLQSLRQLTGNNNFRKDEMTQPDGFLDPYIGKRYEDGYTEVISMGLQYMRTNPADFARRDPDHFDFIYMLMRGDF